MGFELNKLMRQYGLATPTMLSYEGERGPDVEVIDEETGEVTTTPGEITFDPAKQRAFDQYQAQYQSRLRNAPMYAGSQFQTQTLPQPMSYMQMYQQYLGRDPTDAERTDAIALDANITQENPLSLAQRQQFLRRYEDEFKDLGIRNTGNQLVMDTIGNYYGNILRNPDYRATPIDRSLPFEERNPNVVNPNPRYTGPVISVDDAYANAVNVISEPYESSDVIQGYLAANEDVAAHAERTALGMGLIPGTPEYTRVIENTARTHFNEFGINNPARLVEGYPELGRALMIDVSKNLAPPPTYETSQTFLDFADQQDQILSNLANPMPDESINTLEDARNVDPFAESSTGGPAYGAYLAKNLDVLDNITGFRSGTPQPGYAALNIPEGGFAPGTPENAAVQQYLANAAKEHFVNYGFQEGRQFYKTGGPVKGYQLGGLNSMMQQGGGGPQTAEQALGQTSEVGIVGNATSVSNPTPVPTTQEMIDTLVRAAPTVENLYGQSVQAATGFADAQTQFNETVQDIITARQTGPDKAELYFKLAAAFAQPTKSRSFGFLENVPTVLADFAKDTREARTKAQDMEITLAKAKLAQAKNKYDTLQDKRTKQAEDYRNYMLELYKTISEKDQKAAELLLKKSQFEFDKKTLPPEILKIKKADEDGITDLQEGLKQLRKALKVNKSAGPSTKAAMAAIAAREASLGVIGLTEEQRNTKLVMNIIGSFAVKQLKNTFGAQLSDGERQAFFDLMGAGNYPDAKFREDIIAKLIKQTVRTINQKRDRLSRINQGKYRATADDLTLGRKAELTEEEKTLLGEN